MHWRRQGDGQRDLLAAALRLAPGPTFLNAMDLPTTCLQSFLSAGRRLASGTGYSEAISKAYDGDLQMIDSSSIRVHQHGSNGKRGV